MTAKDTPWWEHLKARRLELGLSQYALAKATKLSHPYIMKLETGRVKEPSYAKLSLIAAALGKSVADIFEDSSREGSGASENASARWATAKDDPHVRDVQKNVLAIKELSPQSFDALQRIVAALRREAEAEARTARRAEQHARRQVQVDRRANK